MQSVGQTSSVAGRILQSTLSNTGYIFSNVEIASKLLDRAVDKHRLHDIEGASTTTADIDTFTERTPPRPTMSLKIPSDLDSNR